MVSLDAEGANRARAASVVPFQPGNALGVSFEKPQRGAARFALDPSLSVCGCWQCFPGASVPSPGMTEPSSRDASGGSHQGTV